LAEAIRGALRENERRRERALNAQHLVREKFTWPLVVAEYDRLYAEILPRSAERRSNRA
jgi:hypothetical protein